MFSLFLHRLHFKSVIPKIGELHLIDDTSMSVSLSVI
jgi:hypothetical protein